MITTTSYIIATTFSSSDKAHKTPICWYHYHNNCSRHVVAMGSQCFSIPCSDAAKQNDDASQVNNYDDDDCAASQQCDDVAGQPSGWIDVNVIVKHTKCFVE